MHLTLSVCLLSVCLNCDPGIAAEHGKPIKRTGSLRGYRKDFHELRSGKLELITAPPGAGIIYTADQFYIEVPQGSENLLIELESWHLEEDFDILVRYNLPVEFDEEQGIPIADTGTFTNLGFEELLLWGSELKSGRYYLCLVSFSENGDDLALRAMVNGGFVQSAPGEEVSVRVPADPPPSPPVVEYATPDGHQYRFAIPEGTLRVHVLFLSENLQAESLFAYRFDEPVDYLSQSLWTSGRVVNFPAGFEERCIAVDQTDRPHELYLCAFNDGGNDQILTGTFVLTAEGCTKELHLGAKEEGIVPAVPEEAEKSFSALQYRLNMTDLSHSLNCRVRPTEAADDIDIYLRFGTPVEVREDIVVADLRGELTQGGPEVLTLSCQDLREGECFILVATTEGRPVPYELTVTAEDACTEVFLRGDANADSRIDLADAVSILQYLFCGGLVPFCMDAADANDSEVVDLSDAIYLLGWLFTGSPPVPPPYPECDSDPTNPPDSPLACTSYPPCR